VDVVVEFYALLILTMPIAIVIKIFHEQVRRKGGKGICL